MNDERATVDAKAAEKKRLAEALRANLKRRKGVTARRDAAEVSRQGETPAGKG